MAIFNRNYFDGITITAEEEVETGPIIEYAKTYKPIKNTTDTYKVAGTNNGGFFYNPDTFIRELFRMGRTLKVGDIDWGEPDYAITLALELTHRIKRRERYQKELAELTKKQGTSDDPYDYASYRIPRLERRIGWDAEAIEAAINPSAESIAKQLTETAEKTRERTVERLEDIVGFPAVGSEEYEALHPEYIAEYDTRERIFGEARDFALLEAAGSKVRWLEYREQNPGLVLGAVAREDLVKGSWVRVGEFWYEVTGLSSASVALSVSAGEAVGTVRLPFGVLEAFVSEVPLLV